GDRAVDDDSGRRLCGGCPGGPPGPGRPRGGLMATVLATRGLTRRFGGVVALNGLALEVGAGERHAIIGPNGAGKTTLFNVISGELLPSSGQVRFDGRPITGLAPPPLPPLAS